MITQDFYNALQIVSDVTEISQEDILSKSRKMENVEARTLLITALNSQGYHPIQIANKMDMAVNSVKALMDTFPQRGKSNGIFNKMYIEIMRKLSELEKETYN